MKAFTIEGVLILRRKGKRRTFGTGKGLCISTTPWLGYWYKVARDVFMTRLYQPILHIHTFGINLEFIRLLDKRRIIPSFFNFYYALRNPRTTHHFIIFSLTLVSNSCVSLYFRVVLKIAKIGYTLPHGCPSTRKTIAHQLTNLKFDDCVFFITFSRKLKFVLIRQV